MGCVAMDTSIDFEKLRSMIGLQVKYRGVFCEIVEVLEEDLSLVLNDLEYHVSIQADQHGEAHRRVPRTYTIPIFKPNSTELSREFLAIEPIAMEEV